MKIKTNIRAGQGGADDTSTTDTSTSTSSQNQRQKGKDTTVVYTRCAGY